MRYLCKKLGMRILITGATGLVGSDLVSLCKEKNIAVNYLTRNKDKIGGTTDLQGYHWDPESGIIDTECFEGVSAIVNLAGSPIAQKWTKANKQRVLNSRVQSLRTILKGLEEHGTDSVRSLISASAIGIYPDSLTTFYTEDELERSSGFAGNVVTSWEEELEGFKTLIPGVAVVRIGLVLSDKGGALVKMAKPVRFGAGAAFGSGDQWQSWIHLKDLSRMFLFILEKDLKGIYNGVAPNPVTQNKLIKELAKVFKRPLILPNIPKGILRLMLGEMSEILTSSQRVSSKKIESKGFDFKYQNICRALEGIYLKTPN